MNTPLQLRLYRLAHENNMTLDRFLDRLDEVFHVDTSNYSKTPEGDTIYPDGRIGIELEMPLNEELNIHEAAALSGLTTNQFVENAVQAALDKEMQKNPEAFKDLDN